MIAHLQAELDRRQRKIDTMRLALTRAGVNPSELGVELDDTRAIVRWLVNLLDGTCHADPNGDDAILS
jgi:hypothetical protein